MDFFFHFKLFLRIRQTGDGKILHDEKGHRVNGSHSTCQLIVQLNCEVLPMCVLEMLIKHDSDYDVDWNRNDNKLIATN